MTTPTDYRALVAELRFDPKRRTRYDAAIRLEAAAAIEALMAEMGRLAAAVSWIEPPFVDDATPINELRKRVQFAVQDAAGARPPRDLPPPTGSAPEGE